MTREERYRTNLSDLLRVVIVLCEILETKQLSPVEDMRVMYGNKIIGNITESQKQLNEEDI